MQTDDKILIRKEGITVYQIVYEENEVYEFAAEELANYYAKMTGDILLRRHAPIEGSIPIFLGSPQFAERMTGAPVPLD